jgi:type III secretory pathway component EscT
MAFLSFSFYVHDKIGYFIHSQGGKAIVQRLVITMESTTEKHGKG